MKETDKISKGNPFRVPEDYFTGLAERLVSVSSSSGQAADNLKRQDSGIRSIRVYLLAAASVAVLAVSGYMALNHAGSSQVRSTERTGSISEINSTCMEEIDLATLEENVAEIEDVPELPRVSRNEIIDFLASEEISISDIYEQF